MVWRVFRQDRGYDHRVKGQIRAHIDHEGEVYEIFPLEDGVHAVAKIVPPDSSVIKQGGGCALSVVTSSSDSSSRKAPIKSKAASESESARVTGCSPQVIRVLVLTTARARATGLAGIQSVNLVIEQFNRASLNSGVLGPAARLELAGLMNLAFNETQFNIERDINDLIANPEANRLRRETGADLVVILTDGNYQIGDYQYYGLAGNYDPSNPPELRLPELLPNRSFVIVEADRASANYTFAHEVGHLFAARHQTCDNWLNPGCDNDPVIQHGYGFTRPGALFRKIRRYNTIMHQIRPGYSYIQHFSNPNRTYDTRSTGSPDRHDVARHLRNVGNTVARYRTNREEMSVSISGPDNYTPGISLQPTNYVALVQCGDPTHTYSWQVSFDGFNYTDAGRSDTYSPPYTLPPNAERMSLLVNVRSADGQSRTAFKTVSLGLNLNFREQNTAKQDTTTWWEEISEEFGDDVILEDAYPNSFAKSTEVGFYLPEAGTISLDITDLMGRVVKNVTEGNFEAGAYAFEITRDGLSQGTYFYQLSIGDTKYAKRLIVAD